MPKNTCNFLYDTLFNKYLKYPLKRKWCSYSVYESTNCWCHVGISVEESDPGEITMELEMQWDGNPNVILDIVTKVGVALPIQVLLTWLAFENLKLGLHCKLIINAKQNTVFQKSAFLRKFEWKNASYLELFVVICLFLESLPFFLVFFTPKMVGLPRKSKYVSLPRKAKCNIPEKDFFRNMKMKNLLPPLV